MSVQGKHVVITGGGSGVGADMAAHFAGQGARVSILGRRADALEQVAGPIGAVTQVCDVTDCGAVDDALAAVVAQNGPVDVAVANAGAAVSVPFEKMTVADLNSSLAVNLAGVFNLWQATYPAMKSAGWGRLIVVASTAGLKGYGYVSGYCAAKHGVIGLTRALAIELGRSGVTVNAVCPGFMETPLLDRSIANIVAMTGMTEEKAAKSLRSVNPQGRFIQPNEVSEAAIWLCSDGARSVNGHTLNLSGGEI